MATTTKIFEKDRAFSLDQDTIRRIWDIVAKGSKDPTVEFECSDNTTIGSGDLNTLLNFPNSKTRNIQRVTFRSGYKSEPEITVDFNGKFPSISYSIKGDDV